MKHHDPRQQSGLNRAASSLCDAVLSMRTREEVRQFLTDLCTPAELEAMVDRWGVALLLAEGLSYREISQRTGVSVTTIGRVARFKDMGEGGYQTALQRLGEK
jgi:TrpR-related protein YerC/YecD